jgi:hypothetical protein
MGCRWYDALDRLVTWAPDDITDAQFRATQAAILELEVRGVSTAERKRRSKSVKYALVLVLLQVTSDKLTKLWIAVTF